MLYLCIHLSREILITIPTCSHIYNYMMLRHLIIARHSLLLFNCLRRHYSFFYETTYECLINIALQCYTGVIILTSRRWFVTNIDSG